jgi:hypothetical protein
MSETDIVQIYDKIDMMYTAVNNIVNSFYGVLGVVIALLSGVFIYLIKSRMRKEIEKAAKKSIAKLMDSLARAEYIHGKELISDKALIHNHYEFPVLENVSFRPDLYNKIILHPLIGNKQLNYSCCVKNGRLNIEFENYTPEEDAGVFWTIIYYPEMVAYLNSARGLAD